MTPDRPLHCASGCIQIVVLMQLDKIGVDLAVPVLIMNYDGFYDRLLEFLDEAVEYGEFLPHHEVIRFW